MTAPSPSRRGAVDGLGTAVPLAQRLPAVLQDDEFATRFVAAFDAGFAPILTTLDNLFAYVDPRLAPEDFVSWLAGWVGAEMTPALQLAAKRDAVADAVPAFRRDGTVSGLRDSVARATGGEVELTESGGAAWSATAGAALPGTAAATVHVTVTVADSSPVDAGRVATLVSSLVPAHIASTVEVVLR
jgi:phage tail-like protein